MRKLVRKPINKDIKITKSLFTSIVVTLLHAIVLLIKNALYISYILIYNFNNLISKLFMKLPRILRVLSIYSLITITAMYFIGINKSNQINTKESEIQDIEEVAMIIDEDDELKELEEVEIQNEVIIQTKENKQICNLEKEIECKIYNKGIEVGMTHEQALLIVAISKAETGHWTSNLYINKNNFGGVTKNGKMASYKTNNEGLEAFASLLKRRYFDQGLTTPEKIQPVYCPIGAENDPNNLNKNWLPTVTKFWNEYLNK